MPVFSVVTFVDPLRKLLVFTLKVGDDTRLSIPKKLVSKRVKLFFDVGMSQLSEATSWAMFH